eukprot:1137111-Pelagomonas_calceolata.AAC.7
MARTWKVFAATGPSLYEEVLSSRLSQSGDFGNVLVKVSMELTCTCPQGRSQPQLLHKEEHAAEDKFSAVELRMLSE